MNKYINTILFSFLAFIIASCSTEYIYVEIEDEQQEEEVIPPADDAVILGEYSIRGYEYQIQYASYLEGSTFYSFILSPQDGTSSLSRFVQFDVVKSLEGTPCDIKNDTYIWHKDHYTIIVRSQTYYYPSFRAPDSGTFHFQDHGNNTFSMKIDFIFNDGEELHLNVSRQEFTPLA